MKKIISIGISVLTAAAAGTAAVLLFGRKRRGAAYLPMRECDPIG